MLVIRIACLLVGVTAAGAEEGKVKNIWGTHYKQEFCENIPAKFQQSVNHSQNVPLPTPKFHYGATFQAAIPESVTRQKCFTLRCTAEDMFY